MYVSTYFNILYLKKAYYIVFMVNTLIDRSVLYVPGIFYKSIFVSTLKEPF